MLAVFVVVALSTSASLTDGRAPRAELPPAMAVVSAAVLPIVQGLPAADAKPEPGVIEQYFPFTLNADAGAAVKDGMVLSYVLGIVLGCVGGSLWGPVVAIKGASFDSDLLLPWLVPCLTIGCGGGLIVSCISVPLAYIPVVGWLGSVALWTGVGLGAGYVSTTAVMNAIDRKMKGKGGAPKAAGSPPASSSPPPPSSEPPPNYAY